MNFAIEVPAEANPLTTRTLYHVLQSASSNDQQQVKTGTQQLHNWERSPGYYGSLQSLYIDYSLPVELRYLAIIQLKNGIDKYWRKTATNAIKAEEKDLIRSRCLQSGVYEPDHRLALQISILTAKIVRYEYPQDWPDAIDSVTESLRINSQPSSNPIHLSRTLLILLYVIKELSTAKMQRSRTKLQSVTPGIVQAVSTVYLEKLSKWVSFVKSGGNDEGGALEIMGQSLLALRILRRLIIAGYDFPNRQQEIRDIWSSFTSQFAEMLALAQRAEATLSSQPQYLIDKHLIQISKLHLEMAKNHAAGFALLPDSTALARAYWGLIQQCGEIYGLHDLNSPAAKIGTDGDAEDLGAPLLEQLALKGLLIIRACCKMIFNPAQTFKFHRAEDKEEKKLSKELMKAYLLTDGFAHEAMETLVMHFFRFTPRDLKEWEEEPDEWEKSQEGGGEDWEYSIRNCAEKLFLDLMINYKDMLVQPLMEVFKTVGNVQNTDVLQKDSIYAAIGLAAPVLDRYTEFDFGSFLENTLVQEVQIQLPGYNILRRRAAIVLGQWLPVKEGLNRTLVYQIFQHLLDGRDLSNDQVVRVTSGRQLKNVVEPFEFTAEKFMPFAPAVLGSIMGLIQEVELLETKMALLGTISVIVTKMERQITPFADQIMSLLPPLWDQAGEEYLMKQTILGILACLCNSMQAESSKYHPVVLPLIQSSIEPSSETRVYLLEDALDLWSIILAETSPTAVLPETVSLVQYLFPLFDIASENLRKALEITESYIYLMPSDMLSNAPAILGPLTPLLGNVKRDASGMITSLVELLIRSADSLGSLPAVGELTQALLSTKWLSTILSGIFDAYRASQTTGPKREHSKIDGIVETDYLNVLARLGVASPTLLVSAIEATPYQGQTEGNESIERKMDWLLTEWFAHMDTIGHPTHKKLNCLALTSLLETGQPWILSRLQSMMSDWTSCVTELVIDTSLDEKVIDNRDSLVYTDPEALKGEGYESPGDERRRLLTFHDPVHRIDLRVFIRDKLALTIEGCGGMEAFQRDWVQNVDADVVQSFGDLGLF